MEKCLFCEVRSHFLENGCCESHVGFGQYLQYHNKVLTSSAVDAAERLIADHLVQKTAYFESPDASYSGYTQLEETQKAELVATLSQPGVEIDNLVWAERSRKAGRDLGPVKKFLEDNKVSWTRSCIISKYLSQHLDKTLKPIASNEKFWAGNDWRWCPVCKLQLMYDQGMYEPSRCAVEGCDGYRKGG